MFAPTDARAAGEPSASWRGPTRTTGVDRRCAPSIGGRRWRAASIAGLTGLPRAGYVVTATDYPGLGTPGPHPYLVGDSEAPAVLDSVRAAGQLDGAGAGRSGRDLGATRRAATPALFAGAGRALDLAPELDVVGVATAAPATSSPSCFGATSAG